LGLVLAKAISSDSDFTGNDGCTTMKKVFSPRKVTGVKSVSTL
jgi:hypothetical protein